MSDVLAHFNVISGTEICIIGDRVSTDIVMGNYHGCLTVLVEPLQPSSDNFMVRNVRKFEEKVLLRIVPKAPKHLLV